MTFSYSAGIITQANESGQAITAAADGGTNTVTFTCNAHGYSNGDYVEITGTTDYNGGWEISNVTTNTFDVYYPEDPYVVAIKGSSDGINFTTSQTGTVARGDSSLAGINGLTGVTTVTQANRELYTLDSATRIVVNGALVMDSEFEHLTTTIANTGVYSDGFLQVGRRRLTNGVIHYSRGDIFESTWQSAGGSGFEWNTGGCLWNGGRILAGSRVRIDPGLTTAVVNSGSQYNTNTGGNTQLRMSMDTGRIYNMVMDGFSQPARIFINDSFTTGVFKLLRSFYQTAWALAQDLELVNFDIIENVESLDIDAFGRSAAESSTTGFVNCSREPVVPVDGGDQFDYMLFYRNVSITPVDADGVAIPSFSTYCRDYDNGSRAVGPRNPFDGTQTDLVDEIYSDIDTSGTVAYKILWKILNFDTARTPVLYTDYRTNNGAMTGNRPVDIMAYGFQKLSVLPELLGLGTWVNQPIMVIDQGITVARATADAYTDLDTVRKGYDRTISFQQSNYTSGEYWISRAGEQIVLADKTLILDGTAASVIAYSALNLTWKATSYTGGATATTGSAIVRNGALLNGGQFDCDINYEGGAGTTITGVVCTGVFDFDTAGTYTIASGTTLSEVTNSSGGTVIIQRADVSSTVTTVTGPNVTVLPPEVTVQVTCRDANTLAVIAGARVLLTADTGGDLPSSDSVTITRSGSTASVSHAGHGLSNGDEVLIEGSDQEAYNGIHVISNVTTNAYDYTVSGAPTTPATGTIVATAVVLNGTTNGSGIISVTDFGYTNNQPVDGKARKGTSAPYYVPTSISGTITSNGLTQTAFMVPD